MIPKEKLLAMIETEVLERRAAGPTGQVDAVVIRTVASPAMYVYAFCGVVHLTYTDERERALELPKEKADEWLRLANEMAHVPLTCEVDG